MSPSATGSSRPPGGGRRRSGPRGSVRPGNFTSGVQYALSRPLVRRRPPPRASCFAIAFRLVLARKMPAWKRVFSSAVALNEPDELPVDPGLRVLVGRLDVLGALVSMLRRGRDPNLPAHLVEAELTRPSAAWNARGRGTWRPCRGGM